jgi:hypothetical protein
MERERDSLRTQSGHMMILNISKLLEPKATKDGLCNVFRTPMAA